MFGRRFFDVLSQNFRHFIKTLYDNDKQSIYGENFVFMIISFLINMKVVTSSKKMLFQCNLYQRVITTDSHY